MDYDILGKVRQTASRSPTAPAYIYQNKVITYRQLDAFICSAARIFHQRGIGPGDAVVLLMMQTPVYSIAMLALAAIGAVSVPLNPVTSADARRTLRDRYGVKAVVSDLEGDPGIDDAMLIRLVNLQIDRHGSDLGFTSHRPTPDTPFCIAMSSGTTGEPKGIVYTHRYLLDMVDEAHFGIAGDTRLIALAMHIAFGFVFAIGTLAKGGALLFFVGNFQDLVALINLYAVTHLVFPPVSVSKLLPLIEDGGNPFPSLKRVRVGGSGSSAKLIRMLCAKLPEQVEMVYGLTELGAVSIARADILATDPMSSGKVIPRFALEIVDEHDQVLPADTPGEIRIRLDGMPREYYRDAENTRLKFRNGWYYTGDVGRISTAGLLSVEGRIDDIISINGHKTSPGYVEEILTRHPRVSDAMVFPAKANDGSDYLAAALVLSGGGADQALIDYGQEQLGLAAPLRYFVLKEFPRNSSGKLMRQQVAAAALQSAIT